MIAIKKIVTHSSQEKGECHTMQGHMGKHQGQSGGRGSEAKAWARGFTVFFAGSNG